jgi:ketosteroid isomerase-like protein
VTVDSTLIAANRQLIEDYFAVVSGEDRSRELTTFFSEDVVWHVPQSNPMIKPNPRCGLAAVMDLLTAGVGIYQQGTMRIDVHSIIADQQRVVAQFDMSATLSNANPYLNQYCFVFSVAAARITGVWEYLDTLYQAEQGVFQNS